MLSYVAILVDLQAFINTISYLTKFILSVFISLFIPGSGLLLAGKTKQAFLIPIFALFFIFILGLSRFIVSPAGFAACVLGLLLIHFLSMGFGFYYRLSPSPLVIKKISLYLVLLFFLNTGIIVLSHIYKPIIFGFQLYHIPSNSMRPTLLPGDIVMVDSWINNHSSHWDNLKKGDIVVFNKPNNPTVMIKRILTNNEGMLDLRGDNSRMSADSRQFGLIPASAVLGKAQFIVFSLRNRKRFYQALYLSDTQTQ